jgi:Domain of unknown function (DUF4272)
VLAGHDEQDAAALNELAAALRDYERAEPLDDDQLDEVDELMTDLIVLKLRAQGADPAAIRAATLAELDAHQLPAPPEHLPAILECYAGHRRTTQDAVDRLRTLVAVLRGAYGEPGDAVLDELTRRGLDRWISEEEREMLESGAEEQRAEISWRTEGLVTLAWALGVYDWLPLSGMSSPAPEDFVSIDIIAPAGTPAPVTLRDELDLMTRLDAFYCAHWAVRNHQLTGQPDPWPEEVVGGAVWERRHALEWLLSDTGWDDIDLST